MHTLNLTLRSLLKRLSLNDSFTNLLLGISVVLIVTILIHDYLEKYRSKPQITQKAAQIAEIPSPMEVLGDEIRSFPRKYLVKRGDDLWNIAINEYGWGEAWGGIAKYNALRNPNRVLEGDVITLPVIEKPKAEGMILSGISIEAILDTTYTVQKGDSLFTIAERAYGDGRVWPRLKTVNNLRNPNHLEAGSIITIPR